MVAVRAPGKSIVAVAIGRFCKNWGYQERNLSSGRTLPSISIFNKWGPCLGVAKRLSWRSQMKNYRSTAE
jgi:hypothetical protein